MKPSSPIVRITSILRDRAGGRIRGLRRGARRGLASGLARMRVALGSLVAALTLLAACTTTSVQPAPRGIAPDASWAMLPIVNYTQTPQAGLRAEAILESIVRGRGLASLRRYPSDLNVEALFEPTERNAVDKAMRWARSERVRYGLTGSVDEWRYKVGVDGEPAVGITLQLVDIATGDVVWSATGAKTGWSREGLSGVAQKLLQALTRPLAGLGAGQPGAGRAAAAAAATATATAADAGAGAGASTGASTGAAAAAGVQARNRPR